VASPLSRSFPSDILIIGAHSLLSLIGWPPKIPKRLNFRFSPDKWVCPFRMKWVSEKKIERGGGPPLSIFF